MIAGMAAAEMAHVELGMPADGCERARAFYGRLLALRELPDAPTGCCRFETAGTELHLVGRSDFAAPDETAPPLPIARLARDLLPLREAGVDVVDEVSHDGPRRAFVTDPFGNRLELVDAAGARAWS